MDTKLLLKIVLPVLMSFASHSGNAQTFYVDIQNGNDSNPGTLAMPWQRLDTAINRLDAGEVLYVRGGDYTSLGQILFQKSGTPTQPILISGYLDEFPKVDGFTIGFSSWTNIEQFDIRGPQQIPLNWQDMPDVVIDDPSVAINPEDAWDTPPYRVESVLTKYSTYANFFNYGWNTNPTWESNPSYGINIVNCSDLIIANNKIHHHTYGIRLRNESKRITIADNEIHHCIDGLAGYYDTSSYKYSFGHSTISGNHIYQSFRNGIMLNYGANHNWIDSNNVQYSGQNHISTYNLDVLSDSAGYNIISNNTVAYGGYYAEFMRYPGPSAISIHSSGPGCKVISNYISFQFDPTLRDGNAIISDNNPHGSEFINNVCYRVKGSGVSIVKSRYNTIIHNTIIQAGDGTTSLKNGVAVRIVSDKDTANIIANNIFDNVQNGGISAESGNMLEQTYIDYNLYHFPNGAPIAGNGLTLSDVYYTIPEFNAFSGFESAGIELRDGNQLVDAMGHLIGPDSPAACKGTALYLYPIDKDSTLRNGNTPTIGAYEISSTITAIINSAPYEFNVYPNPTSNVLIIEAIDALKTEYKIFSLYSQTGQFIFSKELDSSKMNYVPVQNLSPGLYIFKYGGKVGRFVKN